MQAIRCPACNKGELTVVVCPRCGCDLTRLHSINVAASASLARSWRCFQEQDWTQALHYAAQSWRLRHQPQAARLAFLAAAGQGDVRLICEWRKRASL